MNRESVIVDGLAHVLERPATDFGRDTDLRAAGVDSIALVVLADLVESTHPNLRLPDEALKFAKTVGDLAAGLTEAAA